MGHDVLADEFAPLMRGVAIALLGEPNKQLSRPDELRFGTKGAISVIPSKGVFFDNHDGHGGGVLQFVMEMGFKSKPEALDYLREFGLATEERRAVQVNGHDKPKRKIAATYDYVDEHGELLFQVVRYTDGEPRFMQRRPDPENADNWIWSTKGVRKIPYRMPDLQEALAHERPIWIVEGEKDVDNLARLGITATCNAGGAGKWPDDCTQALKGAHVVLCGDNDEPGRKHVERVAAAMQGIAASVTILNLDGLPEKGDVSDWIALHPDNPADALWRLYEQQARAPAEEGPQTDNPFGAISYDDISLENINDSCWIKDIIPAASVGILSGHSQAGKSFIAMDMALKVAEGQPWFKHRTERGSIAWVACEGPSGAMKRLLAYKKTHPGSLPVELFRKGVNLTSADNVAAFIKAIKERTAKFSLPLALVVIDTLAAATPGADENKAEHMTMVLSHCQQIVDETGATVLLVHHLNANGNKMRGHTSLPAGVDFSIEVTLDLECTEKQRRRQLKTTKQKDGEVGIEHDFTLERVVLTQNKYGEDVTSCIINELEPTPRSISDAAMPALSRDLKIALVALRDAIQEDPFTPGPSVCGDDWVEACHKEDWRFKFYEMVGDSKSQEAKRKAFQNLPTQMVSRGLVKVSHGFAWLTPLGLKYL